MSNKPVLKGATLSAEPKSSALLSQLKDVKVPGYLLPLMFVLILTGLAVPASHEIMQRWKVDHVELVGRLNVVDAEKLARELVWVKEESFFSLDVQRVHQRIQNMPLVEQLSVRKRWPDTLVIHIQEAVPVAVWNGDQILTASGKLFPVGKLNEETSFVGGLMKLNGSKASAELAIRSYRRIQQAINVHELTIDSMTVSGVGAIDVRLSNEWLVSLGRKDIDSRLDRLMLLLSTLDQHEVARVDFRYGNAAAVSWKTTGETS